MSTVNASLGQKIEGPQDLLEGGEGSYCSGSACVLPAWNDRREQSGLSFARCWPC